MLKQLEDALRTPPKDLTDTYQRALEGLDPDSYELVCKILRLLTVSPRPVSMRFSLHEHSMTHILDST